MDFNVVVGTPAPVVIRINGAEYKVPRFLLPAFKEWAAQRTKQQLDEALAQFEDEKDRAKFRLFYTSAPVDLAALADDLRSPEGVEYVLRSCLPKGGVPPELVEAMLHNADPVQLRILSDQVASVRDAVEQMRADSGQTEDDSKNPPASSASA